MPGVSVESLQNLNSSAVLKFAVGTLLIGDQTAAIPDESNLIGADGKVTIPAGYRSAGLVTTDGLTFSRSMSADDTKSWQTLAVVRSDITADDLSIKVKYQETNAVTMALSEGLTLADAAAKFASAGFSNKRDSSGAQPGRRGILLARDTLLNITLARVLPNITLSDLGDSSIGRSNELQYDATIKVMYDAVYGSDSGLAINGPGWGRLSGSSQAGTLTNWAATKAYAVGDSVQNGQAVLQVTTAGTSGNAAPTNPAVNATVTDGTVTWKRLS